MKKVVVDLQKLEVENVLTRCRELGVNFTHLTGFAGPGPNCYQFVGEEKKIREALSVALTEDELEEVLG